MSNARERAADEIDLDLFNAMRRAYAVADGLGGTQYKAKWLELALSISAARVNVRRLMSAEDIARSPQ